MTSKPDPFDEALTASGIGRRHVFDAGSLGWMAKLFAGIEPTVQAQREQLIREGGLLKPPPEILAGVNDDKTFNASAFPHDSKYVIAVNYGALILIHDLVHRLFCTPEVFPWVGEPSKEDPKRRFHPTSNDAQIYMRKFISEPLLAVPHDPVRRIAADFLTVVAVHYLLWHEFRHIIGGHIDWNTKVSGSRSIAEVTLGGLSSSEYGTARQALEMDADSFAMQMVLQSLLNHAVSSDADKPPIVQGMINEPRHALEIALMCALVMLGTFWQPAGPTNQWPLLNHPPAGVRHVINIWSADIFLQNAGHDSLRTATLGNPDWVARFSNFALVFTGQRCGNPDRRDEMKLTLGPRGRSHFLEIVNAWGRILDEVRKYSFVPYQFSSASTP